MEHKSPRSPSPSASSGFLRLGRRGSKDSLLTTQTERENKHAALDQIHNAAYQSDSLTHFNDFTSPPTPISAQDDKGLSEELQGGLTGLYSRFRTSVGGMRDIVSGGTRPTDKSAVESPPVKSPNPDRSMTKSVSDLSARSGELTPSHPTSSQGSRLHSPVVANFQHGQEAAPPINNGKSSKVSSKSGSISSKASIPPSPGVKGSIAPLTKSSANSTAADPTITQLHVNALGSDRRSRSSSVNLASHGLKNAESSSIGSRDGPVDLSLSQSSSVLSQPPPHSPVLSTKTHGSIHEDQGSIEASGPAMSASQPPGIHTRKPSASADYPRLPDIVSQPALSRGSKNSDSIKEPVSQAPEGRSNSRLSFRQDESAIIPPTIPNGHSRLASQDGGSFRTDPASESSGHVHREDAGTNVPPKASDPALTGDRAKPAPVNTKNRLPGYVMSRASTAESATTVSSLSPLNTAVSRVPDPSDSRAAAPGSDSVISQLRSRLMSRDFWMRDENAKDCFHCGEPFTTFRRKHHCRTCGQIFDSKCTLLIPGTQFGQPGSIRVCKPCEQMINAHEDDSSDFSDSEQSPVFMNPRISELSWGSNRPSVDDDDSSSVISQSIDHVLRTPTMAIPATRRAGEGHNRRSAVLEINPERSLARPTSSRSLRSSLGTRPHSISHKRHHSRQQYIRSFKPYHDDRAPFQRRHADDLSTESRLPAFHKDNIIDPDLAQYLSDDASSGDEQPSLLSTVTDANLSKSGGDSERATFGGFLAAMKKGRSAFGERGVPSITQSGRDADEASISSSRAVNLPRSSRRRNLSVASSIHQRQSPRASKDSMFPQDISAPPVPFPVKLREAGFKMTRSSSMRGVGAPPVELNKASLEHVRKLLRQLLVAASIPNEESWENALVPILLKTADEVDPDVQRGDDMDIRHYIKLKKIPGGRPGDTSYVSGLVFTKNLALKSMSRNIPCPNILILTFPLEYARQQQHFMSLEPVIRQEREFLENLVSRITALKPNLLLVENNVSGLALDLLEKARIATAYNVKPSVLEAVSRCTQTRIVTSMDKLLTTELRSDCSSFDVKTYVHSGRRKTYMYISGCPKELGCTIVLRGAEEDVLAQVKHITEFMVYVVYNLRLETCLMRDEFAKIPTSPTETVKQSAPDAEKKNNSNNGGPNESHPGPMKLESSQTTEKPSEELDSQTLAATETIEVPDDVPMPTYYDNLVQDHQTKILSTSPFVKFEPPYLLMRTREMERRLAYLKRLRDHDEHSGDNSDEKAKSQKFMLITPEMVHRSPRDAPPKVKEVLRAAHDAEYDRVFYHYQTQKRQWEAYVAGNSNMFDPYSHQNIVVLYSLVCTTTSVPCAGPDVFALEFYNEHGDDVMYEEDCTLGHFVQALCGSANHTCGINGCEKLMFEHHRQYVHGDAQLSVMLQPYPSKLRGLQDNVLMWSVCKICGNETQATLMSENTFKYSFGKYLELSFWGRNLHARAGVCPHDLQRDHLRYFGFKDVAVRIQYDTIHLLEIIVPRPRVTWKVDNDLKLRNEVYTRTEQRLSKFMMSVVARLKGINVESVVPELLDASKKEIEDLIKKAQEDHAVLVRHLQDKYNGSRYWEVIPLNEVFRAVQEKVVEWDTIFTDFERNFFPSEKDIKRLATLQLKKIFLDKDATSEITEDPLHTPIDVEDGSTTETEKPRIMRRMTLSPQKAQDVLVSVVEEHAGKKHRDTPQPVDAPPMAEPAEDKTAAIDITDGKHASPQDEAVSQEDVRHLDLAVSTSHSENSPPGTCSSPNLHLSSQDTSKTSAEPNAADEPFKPSTPEAINSATPGSEGKGEALPDQPATPPSKPSAIPRLAEGAFRRSGKGRSPPLLRTQSQPAHLVRDKSFGAKQTPQNLDDPSNSRGESGKASDKKLTERLGFSALKNARFAPGHSLIPRSTPKRGNTHVSNLARHFEQLSREFEKERQRERRQRTRGAQSRAFPLASSKPIVEIYRNVREAVEEREPPVDEEEPMSSGPRHSLDESSRRSDEFLDQNGHQPRNESLPQESPTESFEPGGIVRSDSQLMSEGEPEDNASDEERNTAEGLHPVDSHDEVKLPDDDSMEFKDLAKHERTTLLKMLTNFWSERSASGWTALEYPLTVMDHVFADCDIIVREDEPSSLISFALDSSDYKEKLLSIQQRYDEMEEHQEHQEDSDSGPEALEESRVEHALLRATGTHLKYQFQEGQAKMLCKVFYAEQFDALRKKCGVADRIVESLSRCAKWDSKGGKTKSLFLKTLDDRFILKSLSPIETQAFLKFAPAYFQIMSEALFHELPSAIAKMFGFYQVIIKNPSTGTEFNWFLLLMENLFYDRVPNRIFDLKGSMRNRKVQSTGERDEVLLDENMVDFIYETPLFAREHSKKLLGQSVWNDTLFLGRQNVMDYSLMIAIDEKRSELVVGIIDCIRTYTWDKKLESWIKDRGFAGSSRNRPTVTSPKEYKSRFREAMARYVLQAPRYV